MGYLPSNRAIALNCFTSKRYLMAHRIWSVEDLDAERKRCAKAGSSFYPDVAPGGPAAERTLAELYGVTSSTPLGNIHRAPVTIDALIVLLSRWERATGQFEGRHSWLVIQRDIEKDGQPKKKLPQSEPRRGGSGMTPDGPMHRRRLGLTWFERETASPIRGEKVRDEVAAVFLTAGEGSPESANTFFELAAEGGRVLLGLLPPDDYDRRLRPPAYWAGFMFKLLQPRGAVKACDDFLLIDYPFAAAAGPPVATGRGGRPFGSTPGTRRPRTTATGGC
jgi:hypothetical protein